MRDIKFRGMDANGIMRYGRLSQDKPNETVYYAKYSQRICWGNSNIPVSNETLGEFTGLKDKHGKEVYNGDILHDLKFPEQYFKVEWNDEGAKFTLICTAPESCKGTDEECDFDILQEMEIVGNIHETPELVPKHGGVI